MDELNRILAITEIENLWTKGNMKKLPRVQHEEINKWYMQNKRYMARRTEQDSWYNLIGVPEEEETANEKGNNQKRIAENLPEQKKN